MIAPNRTKAYPGRLSCLTEGNRLEPERNGFLSAVNSRGLDIISW